MVASSPFNNINGGGNNSKKPKYEITNLSLINIKLNVGKKTTQA